MRISGPTREVSNPRANERAHAHAVGPTYVLVRALGVVLRTIRLGEFSMVCVSVAIPTIWLRGGARCWGNCMRHSLDSSPGGDHALPLVALLVAQPLAPLVALLVGQPLAPLVACWWWLVVGVGMERDGTPCGGAVPRVLLCCGGVLLSHNLSVAVPLALPGLASRFGMVLGVSPVL